MDGGRRGEIKGNFAQPIFFNRLNAILKQDRVFPENNLGWLRCKCSAVQSVEVSNRKESVNGGMRNNSNRGK